MEFDLYTFVLAFIPLLVIADPFLAVPIFHSLTKKFSKKDKMKAVTEATIVAFALMLLFAVAGTFLLELLRVSLGSFRVAGGVLLLYIAFEMFTGRMRRNIESKTPEAIGAVPIGTPVLAGPGALSMTMLLESTPEVGLFYVIPAITLVCALAFVFLSTSKRIFKFVGENEFLVLNRLMGLLVAAIALEFIRLGLAEWGLIALG